MAWTIEWDKRAAKQLKALDVPIQKKILRYLRERLLENPRNFGKELVGNKAGLWRYRVDDHRVVCRIEDEVLVVFVVKNQPEEAAHN